MYRPDWDRDGYNDIEDHYLAIEYDKVHHNGTDHNFGDDWIDLDDEDPVITRMKERE